MDDWTISSYGSDNSPDDFHNISAFFLDEQLFSRISRACTCS